jgi:hypothetical protein
VACAKDWLVDSPQLPDGLSLDRESYFSALTSLAHKHAPFLEAYPAIAEERWAEVGWRLLVNRRKGGLRWLRKALRVRPLSLHLPTAKAGYLVVRYKRSAKKDDGTLAKGPGSTA